MRTSPYYKELVTIKEFYGDTRARRSGELYMEHIISGLAILYAIGASDNAKRAFCLHPIVQTGCEDQVDVSWSVAYELAHEYRIKANSYLCRPRNDWVKTVDDVYKVVGTMSQDCADMLYADKIQNRLSFEKNHKGVHQRSAQLEAYFDIWIEYIKSNRWKE